MRDFAIKVRRESERPSAYARKAPEPVDPSRAAILERLWSTYWRAPGVETLRPYVDLFLRRTQS